VFLVNSRYPLVSAAPSSSGRKVRHPNEALLLPKLRRDFAEFLNHRSPDRLGILYLSTCVGYGVRALCQLLSGFSRQHGIGDFAWNGSVSRLSLHGARIYLVPGLHAYPRTTIAWAHLPDCVPASLASYRWVGSLPKEQPLSNLKSAWARAQRYRNINRLCIDYAFRPRLSSRLTLGGLAFPRNPWTFGGGGSHPSFATHTCILTRPRSTPVHTVASLRDRRSPTAPA
jgi:hypothetical protein